MHLSTNVAFLLPHLPCFYNVFSPPPPPPLPTNNDFVAAYQPGSTVDIGKISSCTDQYAAKGDKMSMVLPSFLWKAANADPEEKVRGYE